MNNKKSNMKARNNNRANGKSNTRKFKALKASEPNNYQDLEVDDIKAKSRKFSPPPKMSTQNDPQWYFKDANILRDVASYSFQTALGTNNHYSATIPQKADRYTLNAYASVPGVMAFEIGLTPGVSTSAQSPLNLAATNVYSYVRYKNSGHTNYDSPDLMLYLLANDSLYACWNWMKRLYGLASMYSQTNKYWPKALITANNVDFDNLIMNLADFRAYLNIKAQEIAAFCVPATMTYNVRHSWLFANVFKDSDTNKAQSYIYVPSYFFKYDETSLTTGGNLEVVPVWMNDTNHSTGSLKVADLINMLNGMLEAMNYSEDMGVMSGDIMKAYGEGNLYTLSTIDADYKVEAVYSREILSQIENMTPLFGSVRGNADLVASDWAVTQDPDTNQLKWQPVQIPAGEVYERRLFYINFHWSDPTPEDVIVASRLMSACEPIESSGTPPTKAMLMYCGSEVAIDAWMYGYGFSSDWTVRSNVEITGQPTVLNAVPIQPTWGFNSAYNSNELWKFIAQLSMLSAFDWHPYVVCGIVDEAGTTSTTLPPFFDFDKFANVDENNLAAMHELALLTEFNVPN